MPFQFIVGDWAARKVFQQQPVKFAAQELVLDTHRHVSETIGGLLIDGKVRFGVKIPGLASWLADQSTDTKITGLRSVPPRDRPPANVVHLAFDVMVGVASALLALALWFGVVWWRKRDLPRTRWFLRAASFAGAAAVVAMEAGWVVTEVGRQPWIVYHLLRTEDAVTRADGVWVSLVVVLLLYAAVGTAAVLVLRAMSRRWRAVEADDSGGPYGPPPGLDAGEPERLGARP
jgi:cytochrome d ubiquinol oxidase subunit I